MLLLLFDYMKREYESGTSGHVTAVGGCKLLKKCLLLIKGSGVCGDRGLEGRPPYRSEAIPRGARPEQGVRSAQGYFLFSNVNPVVSKSEM
jgi:hypothetical protein